METNGLERKMALIDDLGARGDLVNHKETPCSMGGDLRPFAQVVDTDLGSDVPLVIMLEHGRHRRPARFEFLTGGTLRC